MGKFKSKIRNGEIYQPNNREFNLKYWEEKYHEWGDNDLEDNRIYESGNWVFKKYESIRNKISNNNFDLIPPKKIIEYLIGIVNRDTHILMNIDPNIQDGQIMEAILHQKYQFHPSGPILSIEDKFESIIDSLKYPLMVYYKKYHNKSNSKTPKYNGAEFLQWLRKYVNFGQYYYVIDHVWADCLWKNYFVHSTEDFDIIKVDNNKENKNYAVGKFRIDSLQMQMTRFALSIWKDDLSFYGKDELTNYKIVHDIQHVQKKRKYIIGKVNYDNDVPPKSLVSELNANELYFNNLLDQVLPLYPEITIRELLKFWHVLYSISSIKSKKFPLNTGLQKIGSLKQFSTNIKRIELENVIVRSLDVSIIKAKNMIEIMLYKGKNYNELWTTPLIEINDIFYFSIGSIMYPNLLRSIEFWMKQGKLNLSERGKLFEVYCRDEINRAINESNILNNAGVHMTGYIMENEEIDIIFWVGNKIFLCEVKCILFPTSPLEYYNYLKRVSEAKEQIDRKRTVISKHKNKLLQDINIQYSVEENNIEIEPLIITNLQFGSGNVLDDIPVTDLFLLNKYLREGKVNFFIEIDEHGNESARHTEMLYNNEDEAIKNIVPYLKDPTLLKVYNEKVKVSELKYPNFLDGDKPWSKEYLEVSFN